MSANASGGSAKVLSPAAMLSMAHRFAKAAAKLQEGQHIVPGYPPVTHYLYGHSIELGFKAYLLAKGWSEPQLRKLGHDLTACMGEACGEGIETVMLITPEEKAAVGLLNEAYEAKALEYASALPSGGNMMTLPSTGTLDGLFAKMWATLRVPCADATKALRA